MNLKPGTRLGPYEILSPIEAGGMGSVYRARDTRLSREVAIKVPPLAALSDERMVKRFEREARAAAALLHPNVVAVHDVGDADFTMTTPFGDETVRIRFLVEEYVEGCSLRKLMRAGRAPAPRIVQIGIGIARGLAAAHDKGLIHRDLKPENVLIDRAGHPKIADFGLVRFLYPDSAVPDSGEEKESRSSVYDTLTRTGFVVGTLGYMSPEQARGDEVGPASDLFVFGVLLYELLTGAAPFASTNAERAFAAVLKGQPVPIEERAPETPPALREIVERCLEKRPADRYRSAHELLADLEAVRKEIAAGDTGETPSARRAAKPLPPLVWVVGAGAVFLGFAGGFAAGYGRGPVLAMPRELIDERRSPFAATLSPARIDGALELALAPDGRAAAYAAPAAEGGGSDLFVASLAETVPPRRISDEAGGHAPQFTADGRTVLFAGARAGTEPALWQAPADGSTPPVLLVAEGDDPALSPDESRVAFVRRSPQGSALWLAARDGTSPRLLLDTPRHALRLPVFAPDGASLVLWDVRGDSESARLVTVPLAKPKLSTFGTGRLFAPLGRPVFLPGGGIAAISWEDRRAVQVAPGATALKPLPFGAGLALLAGGNGGLLTRAPGGPLVIWK